MQRGLKRACNEADAPVRACWGGELAGFTTCAPVKPMSGAFKEHFCADCREGTIFVPASRIRIVEVGHELANTPAGGLWNVPARSCAVGLASRRTLLPAHRIVNQTKCCSGAKLAILKEVTPHALPGLLPLPVALQNSVIGFKLGKSLQPVVAIPLPLQGGATPDSTNSGTSSLLSASPPLGQPLPPSEPAAAFAAARETTTAAPAWAGQRGDASLFCEPTPVMLAATTPSDVRPMSGSLPAEEDMDMARRVMLDACRALIAQVPALRFFSPEALLADPQQAIEWLRFVEAQSGHGDADAGRGAAAVGSQGYLQASHAGSTPPLQARLQGSAAAAPEAPLMSSVPYASDAYAHPHASDAYAQRLTELELDVLLRSLEDRAPPRAAQRRDECGRVVQAAALPGFVQAAALPGRMPAIDASVAPQVPLQSLPVVEAFRQHAAEEGSGTAPPVGQPSAPRRRLDSDEFTVSWPALLENCMTPLPSSASRSVARSLRCAPVRWPVGCNGPPSRPARCCLG